MKRNQHSITHGMRKSHFYRVYWGIKSRCNNPNVRNYHLYGGRGIKLEWETFEDFRDDMYQNYLEHKSKNPGRQTTIERINVNDGYHKGNCIWVNYQTQNRNRRNNHVLEFNGEKHCVTEWAEILNVNPQRIFNRLRRGWSVKKALTTPHRYPNRQ